MDKSDFIGRAYTAGAVGDSKAFYDEWARTYERDVLADGYLTVARCAEALARCAPDRRGPVADLGCGTGLSGKALSDAGFSPIDGYDFSRGMLEVAATRSCYRKLEAFDLGAPETLPEARYRHAALIGVLHPDHAPPAAIGAALGVIERDGCLVLSMNDRIAAIPEYQCYIDALAEEGRAELALREYGPHLPTREIGAFVVVLRRRE